VVNRQTLAVLAVSVLLVLACGSTDTPDGSGTSATTVAQEPATTASATTTASVTSSSSTVPVSVVTTGPVTTPSTTEPAETTTTASGGEMDEPPPSTTEAAGFPPETVGSAGVGDSFYPLLGNGGYDVIHYEIELDVDPVANTLEATTALSALATHDLSSFNLDLSGLDVEAVAVNGEPAAYTRDGSEMTVRSPVLIPEGEPFSVTVSYSGTPEQIDDPGVPFMTMGWKWVDGVFFTVNQPSAAMSWFPGNNHPTDKATFMFRITVPAGTTAAATGVLVEEVTDDGSTTATWQMDDPMATYLAAVYIGDFERRETLLADGLLIRDYVPPDFDPTLTSALSIAPDAIRYFETIFGPYPFEAYGTLVLPFETGYALENQTLSVHGARFGHPGPVHHRPRGHAPVDRQLGDDCRLERHLDERGFRLLHSLHVPGRKPRPGPRRSHGGVVRDATRHESRSSQGNRDRSTLRLLCRVRPGRSDPPRPPG